MIHTAVRPTNAGETSDSFTRQGSLRRVLPSHNNKENIFGRENEDISIFYKAVQQEYIILAEYRMVVSENLNGIYVIPSRENARVWFGVIFVRSGPYEDGIFRFTIILPENFPDCEHPKVEFQSEVFHPVIKQDTNELYLLNGFPVWNKGEQHIWQVVKYIQWIFYNFTASFVHSVDQEMVDLYKNDQEIFKEKIKDCVKISHEQLYNAAPASDKHYITFEKYVPDLHDPIRASMISKCSEEHSVTMGHSWVAPGCFKPLSKVQSSDSESDT